jgi:hypothetical protein
MEQLCTLFVGLLQIEIIRLVDECQNLDALLGIGPLCTQIGTELPLQGLLLDLILGMEVRPPCGGVLPPSRSFA